MKEILLNQAFEESRYYRKFHHTVFVLTATLYAGLMALQLNANNSLCISSDTITFCLLAFVIVFVIPGYFCYLICEYHEKISKINAVISIYSRNLLKSIRINDPEIPQECLDEFLFKKYGDAVIARNCCFNRAVGKGHWFFIVIVLLLVLINVVIYMSCCINSI
ncbi:hypothetical protein C8R30_11151 [Nitrosomonas nitrosa]|uniref:Uncharacterized protein n=2 Tax=Nitrosomonas nitrosa TaxID=52442 RepID=A0A1I4Q0I1_9PROT|nr:hypothetical protein [Nitrosomonas nitrosa]PTQ97472.1 hypothetical protein C8R30_11151 [Nitrosomonas nitrosa]SFM33376.1 hypothetical protein SAMN05421880_11350 [Nitrosomonas nitrosa]